MSPQGEKYHEQARQKSSRNRVSSLPRLPSRTFFLKDQYFYMQDHPVLCKEETTGGDLISSSRASMSGQSGVAPMQRCLECRTRALGQHPSFAGCRTSCCREVGQNVARKKKSSGPKLRSFHRIIVLINSEGGVSHARASTWPGPRAVRACGSTVDALWRGLVRGCIFVKLLTFRRAAEASLGRNGF